METLRIYFKLLRISLLGRMQYRADFLTGMVSVILLNSILLSAMGLLVNRFQHLHGWRVWDLVFLYGLWVGGHSLYSLLFWHLFMMEDFIVEGRFDQMLIRPIGVLVQFLGQGIQYMGVGDMLVSAGAISLAYRNLGLQWGIWQWLFLWVAVLSGTVIETSTYWIIGSLSFWTGRSRAGTNIVVRFMVLVQQYPVDLFGTWFRWVVTGLIPVAFMNYYPALLLLGKLEKAPYPWMAFLSPVVAGAMLAAAYGVWRMGLRRYASSGS
jgi:ABC-2 type transport system permease protein